MSTAAVAAARAASTAAVAVTAAAAALAALAAAAAAGAALAALTALAAAQSVRLYKRVRRQSRIRERRRLRRRWAWRRVQWLRERLRLRRLRPALPVGAALALSARASLPAAKAAARPLHVHQRVRRQPHLGERWRLRRWRVRSRVHGLCDRHRLCRLRPTRRRLRVPAANAIATAVAANPDGLPMH